MEKSNIKSQLYKKAENKTVLSSLLILTSIIVWMFYTSDIYWKYIENTEQTKALETKLEALKSESNALKLKKDEYNNNNELKETINKYAWKFREDYIINQIYAKNEWINVNWITMDKWQKLPSWLSMANISISVDAKTISNLNKYIEYLTSDKNKVRFVIKSISSPINTENLSSSTTSNISLWMYYYE